MLTSAIAPSSLFTISALSGVASHVLYFIRGEHHTQGIKILTFLFSAFLVLLFFLNQGNSLFTALWLSIAAFTTYAFALWTSMVIYRVFFHRLKGFKGPRMDRVAKFFHAWHARKMNNFLLLDEIHAQYGDFVRIGPCELSVTSPSAMHEFYGPQSKCTKGPWYDASLPLISMHQARDREVHNRRRRVWDKGFSSKALSDYETRVTYHTDLLMQRLGEMSGTVANASLWFNFYSFDVMGDLAFGKSFNMLGSGEEHFAVTLLHKGMRGVGFLGALTWSVQILSKIPFLGAGYLNFLKFCNDQVEERKAMGSEKPDVFSWLLKAPESSGDSFSDRMWLCGDARLIIVAGSDTTAATLTYLFYELAKDQKLILRLREELASLAFTNKELSTCEFLNGAINESLRLHPPVPSGLHRLTPPEGITVDGTYIPGGVDVCVPHRQTSRDPRNYREPMKFLPERWYSMPEMIINKSVFAPFGGGVYSCVGKQLALMELRAVIARIVMGFDVEFGPGEDGTRLMTETIDTFTVALADIDLRFTRKA